MKFIEYNITNNDGKSNCVIRSFCKIFNESYNDVYDELCQIQKELNCENYNNVEVFETYMKNHNVDPINYGKGNKERIVYFSVPAKKRLAEYLESRTDDNPALFVSLKRPHDRATKGSIEKSLTVIGDKINCHVYPHRFRHTCATTLLAKGMPIEEVSKFLGHEKVETTMIYCTVKDELIEMNYRKIMI